MSFWKNRSTESAHHTVIYSVFPSQVQTELNWRTPRDSLDWDLSGLVPVEHGLALRFRLAGNPEVTHMRDELASRGLGSGACVTSGGAGSVDGSQALKNSPG